jgi:hypothetical protein
VLFGVLPCCHHYKILNSVVILLPIDVVNDFTCHQPPPDDALHDEPVLPHIAIGVRLRMVGVVL